MIAKTTCLICGCSLQFELPEKDEYGFAESLIKTGLTCDNCKDSQQKSFRDIRRNKLLIDANLMDRKTGEKHDFLEFDESIGNKNLWKWAWDNRFSSLYIAGKYDIGKTRVAVSVAGKIIEETSLIYFRTMDLLKIYQAKCAQSMDQALRFIQMIESKNLLILDDLGKEKLTNTTTEILFGIVDHRYAYRRHKKLWITTNYSGPELIDRLGPDRGEAVVKRLRAICKQQEKNKPEKTEAWTPYKED